MSQNISSVPLMTDVFYGVMLVFAAAILPSASKDISSMSVRAATRSKIKNVNSNIDNTDELYSRFLLVQRKDDYMKLWNDIYTIAIKNGVVLPSFEDKGEQSE
ncbi:MULTISPECIES: hypothetical protein [Vibrio]|uniref:hypothetical protein n=1 Tax=Vibrio TaxID=662 RepID=UPI001BD58E52|nr:hypothetical protein [Vibrio crassostreae]